MGFRISDATIFLNAIRYNRQNRYQLSQVQDQIGSGKRINSLGDDPSDAARVLGLRRDAARLEQFERNIGAARARLEPSESRLGTLTDVLVRLREIVASADLETERDEVRMEVEQTFEELFQIANTRLGDGYLFSGFRTDLPAYTSGGAFPAGVDAVNPTATYNGDANVMQVQIGEAVQLESSIPGSRIFSGDFDGDGSTDAGRIDLFDLVREIRNRLLDPSTGNPQDMLEDIDTGLQQVIEIRGRVGTTLNRLDTAEKQLGELAITVEEERTAIEDIDLVEASTRLARYETTYQASLAVSARVLQPSLLDFLG